MNPKMKPTDEMPTWKKESRWERAISRARFLTLHELMSDAERSKFDRRFKKWLADNNLELVDKGSVLAPEAADGKMVGDGPIR